MINSREKLMHSEKYLSQCHVTHYKYHMNNLETGYKFVSAKMATHPVSVCNTLYCFGSNI